MKKVFLLVFALLMKSFSYADEGMWIPLFLNYNEAEMQKMGFKLTADDIYSINHHSMKDGIVLFGGGCTGELISPDGLLITNHHCGYSFVQQHSSLEHNYLHNGFWATDKSMELSNPGLTVTFLVRMEDVTAQVLEGVEENFTETQRLEKVAKNITKIQQEAIKGTHYEAIIKPFFYGNQYFLFVNEVFKDVRLVGTPPENIGKFGGDTDNWMWPVIPATSPFTASIRTKTAIRQNIPKIIFHFIQKNTSPFLPKALKKTTLHSSSATRAPLNNSSFRMPWTSSPMCKILSPSTLAIFV